MTTNEILVGLGLIVLRFLASVPSARPGAVSAALLVLMLRVLRLGEVAGTPPS